MKFSPKQTIPMFLLMYAMSAYAQTAPEFSSADKNKDGVLDVKEAAEALPSVQITDENGDGLFNIAEAEKSVEGLQLPVQSLAGDKSVAPVGQNEYRLIVQAIESRDSNDA